MSTAERHGGAGVAQPESRAAPAINWPLHAVFAVVSAAFLIIHARTLASLVYTWAHAGTYEYAFLIFPVCLVLVWLRGDWLRLVTGAPRWRGLIGVAALSALWLAGAVADINLVQHFAVVALPGLLIYSIYGPAVAGVLMFPLAYMFFAVPWGNFMVGPLQDITAHLSVFALQLTDLPVYMTGRIIQTPASTWHVAQACSGVKFFIATTAFGVLYANLFFQSTGRRLIFVACSLIVPIIANGLRVFFTILIGEYFGVEYATGTDHLIFGWQFFGAVMVLLFLAGWPWHEPEPAARTDALSNPAPRHNVNGVPGVLGLGALTIVVLAVAPGWQSLARTIASQLPATPALTLPATLAGVPRGEKSAARIDSGVVFDHADDRTTAVYGRPGDAVRLDYARYDGQSRSRHELITSGNQIFDATTWQVDARRPVMKPSAASGMTELALSRRQRDRRVLVWYAYTVNARLVTSPLRIKLWQAWTGLRAAPLRSAAIVLTTPIHTDSDGRDARARLQRIAPAALDAVRDHAGHP